MFHINLQNAITAYKNSFESQLLLCKSNLYFLIGNIFINLYVKSLVGKKDETIQVHIQKQTTLFFPQ